MFIHNQIIDAIQAGKKQIVTAFVADSVFKAELERLIDVQALATKSWIESSLAIAEAFVKNTIPTDKE